MCLHCPRARLWPRGVILCAVGLTRFLEMLKACLTWECLVQRNHGLFVYSCFLHGITSFDFRRNGRISVLRFAWPAWDKTHVMNVEVSKMVSLAVAFFLYQLAGKYASRRWIP